MIFVNSCLAKYNFALSFKKFNSLIIALITNFKEMKRPRRNRLEPRGLLIHEIHIDNRSKALSTESGSPGLTVKEDVSFSLSDPAKSSAMKIFPKSLKSYVGVS